MIAAAMTSSTRAASSGLMSAANDMEHVLHRVWPLPAADHFPDPPVASRSRSYPKVLPAASTTILEAGSSATILVPRRSSAPTNSVWRQIVSTAVPFGSFDRVDALRRVAGLLLSSW